MGCHGDDAFARSSLGRYLFVDFLQALAPLVSTVLRKLTPKQDLDLYMFNQLFKV